MGGIREGVACHLPWGFGPFVWTRPGPNENQILRGKFPWDPIPDAKVNNATCHLFIGKWGTSMHHERTRLPVRPRSIVPGGDPIPRMTIPNTINSMTTIPNTINLNRVLLPSARDHWLKKLISIVSSIDKNFISLSTDQWFKIWFHG